MNREVVSTDAAPKAIGPYEQGICRFWALSQIAKTLVEVVFGIVRAGSS